MKSIQIEEDFHKYVKLEATLTDKTISEVVDNMLDSYYTKEKREELHGRI